MNKKIFSFILIIFFLGLAQAGAQLPISKDKLPMVLLSGSKYYVSYLPQTVSITVKSNTGYTASTSASWLKVRKSRHGIVVRVDSNFSSYSRTGEVSVTSEDGSCIRTATIIQTREELVNTLKGAGDFGIFADTLYTTLRPGVTQKDIDTVKNYFVKNLAQKIYNKTYDFKFRLGTYKCLYDPTQLAAEWKIGSYDQYQGVTGIMIQPGKFAVAVQGIPDNGSVTLSVNTWMAKDDGYFSNRPFTLHNGLNILSFSNTYNMNGLAYIRYYKYSREDSKPDIKVHFLNGIQNGVLSLDYTNDEMLATLQKAPDGVIDLIGSRMNAVFETKALIAYTKGEYRRYINLLDTIISWEQHLQGLDKYNRLTDNKPLAYVNYHYYMYRDGTGASFKYDTQNRVLSVSHIMKTDEDVLWGISHEWGHLHQISPYFCWSGMTEVTNNMHSAYNTLHMGYSNAVKSGLSTFRNDFIVNDPKGGKVSESRTSAYNRRSNYSWNPKMYAVFESMKNDTIAKRDKDPDRAMAFAEAYPEAYIGFYAPYVYFSKHGVPDYFADLYESLRTIDSNTDKYAVIACAQNGISAKLDTLKKNFKTSCWVTDNYIKQYSYASENAVPFMLNYVRMASRVCGYNLYPYFERIGFMRTIALTLADYGTKSMCMTKEMRDEFKADMDALVADGTLKAMPDGMVEEILAPDAIQPFEKPVIPN
jgi:hypothetical protein